MCQLVTGLSWPKSVFPEGLCWRSSGCTRKVGSGEHHETRREEAKSGMSTRMGWRCDIGSGRRPENQPKVAQPVKNKMWDSGHCLVSSSPPCPPHSLGRMANGSASCAPVGPSTAGVQCAPLGAQACLQSCGHAAAMAVAFRSVRSSPRKDEGQATELVSSPPPALTQAKQQSQSTGATPPLLWGSISWWSASLLVFSFAGRKLHLNRVISSQGKHSFERTSVCLSDHPNTCHGIPRLL